MTGLISYNLDRITRGGGCKWMDVTKIFCGRDLLIDKCDDKASCEEVRCQLQGTADPSQYVVF
jgi:hypothetical protein